MSIHSSLKSSSLMSGERSVFTRVERIAILKKAGKFDDEIVPMTRTMLLVDKETGATSTREVTVSADEGIRADTTYEGVAKIKPAIEGGVISAGNASQFSDGAGACVLVSDTYAQQKNLKPLGRFLGFAVAGCDRVLALGSCGGLHRTLPPGTTLVLDDFISFAPRPESRFVDGRAVSVPEFDAETNTPVFVSTASSSPSESVSAARQTEASSAEIPGTIQRRRGEW